MNQAIPDLRTKTTLAVGYLPQRRKDDLFIVGHPRSGMTWLKTMVTNVLIPESNSDPDVFRKAIPGFSLKRIYSISRKPSPRFISSHTSFFPWLPKVVYIVRDGRDVLASLYRYVTIRKRRLTQSTDRETIMEFPEFYQRYYKGRYHTIWHMHVESWLIRGTKKMGRNIIIVRYEDMKKNTADTLSNILTFAGVNHSEKEIVDAVNKAGLENVREIEKKRWKQKGLGEVDEKSSFYGKGKSGNYDEYFSKELLRDFMCRSEKAMKLAGYL
jgi:hypothetical protein